MTALTTSPSRRAMVGAIGIGTTALVIGAPAATSASTGVSPRLSQLLDAERQANKASDDYEQVIYQPLFAQHRDALPRPAAFQTALDQCERLSEAATSAVDAIVMFPSRVDR